MLTTVLNLIAAQQLATSSFTPSEIPPIELPANAYAQKKTLAISPVLKAKAAFAIDLEDGQILFSQNSGAQMPMASLTKLMVAYIILQEHQLTDIVQVDPAATDVEPSKAYLLNYEKIEVKELIKALIIKSANDATLALAIFDSGSEEKFVEKMNNYAKKIGLNNTHFENSTGFDSENHFSSAEDMALLARKVYQLPYIQKIAAFKATEIISSDEKFTHQIKATNDLLNSYLKVLGLKTGTTDLAGQCLITIVENRTGNKILNVVLNSPDRFQESKLLAQWIFDNYNW